MELAEYCGNIDFSILQFIFSLTDDIKEKISQKKLFYKEQITRYITQQIDYFFKSFTFNKALLQTYKNEAFNTIMFKLKNTIKEHIIFQCA
jgi:hypothetical protein